MKAPRGALAIALYGVGAFVLYKLLASSPAAAAASTIQLGPGVTVAVKAPVGSVAFVLPAGAAWNQADMAPTSAPSSFRAIAVPSGNAPLILASVAAGMTYGFQWRDGAGVLQGALMGFV